MFLDKKCTVVECFNIIMLRTIELTYLIIELIIVFGRKATIDLDNVLKSRDITLLTKVHIVKAMVFPVVMCECESWIINKVEH